MVIQGSTSNYDVKDGSHVPYCPRPPPLSDVLLSIWVRYCISGWLFLTVSNAHQIPQVGGLRGLIGSKASTFTEGLGEAITSKLARLSSSHGWKFAAWQGLKQKSEPRLRPDLIYTWVVISD